MQQPMNGVSMMPPMMNQNMSGISMNQFNTNISMGNQPQNMNSMNPMGTMNTMNTMNSMNPMNSMSAMNAMNSMNTMNPMSSMNTMNPMNTMNTMNSMSGMNPMNSINPMNSMESLNPMMPVGSNMNQFPQQMSMGNNQYPFQNPRRMSQNSIQSNTKSKKSFKQMYPTNNPNAVANPNPNLNPPQQTKKKSLKSSQSKVSMVQPPIPQQPPIPPSSLSNTLPNTLPSNVINTPQASIIPPKFQPPSVQMSIVSENEQFFKRLNGDKLELFLRLFECNSKRKEDPIEYFKSHVFVPITTMNPNFPALIHALVAGIEGESYSKLKDPPLPLIYKRVKLKKSNGSYIEIHPTYKFIQLSGQQIEIQPTQKEKKARPRVIASFLSFGETSPPTTLIVDKEEIRPLQYAINDFFYPLITDDKIPTKIQIQYQSLPFPFLTWLIIQYVELKSPVEVVRELMAKSGLPVEDFNNDQIISTNPSSGLAPIASTPSFLPLSSNPSGSVPLSGSSSSQLITSTVNITPSPKDLAVYAKTPMCQGCSFQLYNIIEEIIKNGSAKCPSCGVSIILNDLILEVKEDAIQEAAENEASASFIDNSSEALISQMQFGDQIYLLMPVHPKEPDWKDVLYGGKGIPVDDDAMPFQYHNTEEYIKKINETM